MGDSDPKDLIAPLRRLGLVAPDVEPEFTALTGGVASDIWLVSAGDKVFVVKRALAKLRVTADWRVPVGRNASEAAWLEAANAAVPGCAPSVIAHDTKPALFAMAYLPAATHPVWKRELQVGRASADFAGQVGAALAAIHAATAGRPEIAPKFNDDALFRAIRLEPYLEFTAAKHPALKGALDALVTRTLENRKALVHGDVSPKNILVGRGGPVFLDAECAWFGDPAFDLAFCLNHLLLKCLWLRSAAEKYLGCFDALAQAYLTKSGWEPAEALETRAAALLPALLLARIDGKSPVEYVTSERTKQGVRDFAARLIEATPQRLSELRRSWAAALSEIEDQNDG
jgi:aminoglycoside phosphotransferase (APT) family kinase protein